MGRCCRIPLKILNFAERYCLLPFGGELMTTNTRNTSYTWRKIACLDAKFQENMKFPEASDKRSDLQKI